MYLEQFLTLDVMDLIRAGMFARQRRKEIKLEWDRGTDYASLTAVTDLTGYVPFAVLSFYYSGGPVEQSVTLRFRRLYNGGVLYYFVCPLSGMSCKKLYFSQEHGQFIGRVATRSRYIQQAKKREREAITARPYKWRIRRGAVPVSVV